MPCIKSSCLLEIYLTENLDNCGLPEALFDPCIYIVKKVIAICYIDDLIFWAINEKILLIWLSSCMLKELI